MTPRIFTSFASHRPLSWQVYISAEHCTNWHSGSATGFPLSKDGVFATNYHVIGQPDGETLAVMDTEGNIFPVTDVLAGDEKSDVAILRAAGAKFRPLPLGDPAAIGSSVHVISHPDGTFYYYSKGMVSLYDGIMRHQIVPLTRMDDHLRGLRTGIEWGGRIE